MLKLEQLETRLRNPRTRLRSRDAVIDAADKALGEFAHRWVDYEILEEKENIFKKEIPRDLESQEREYRLRCTK